MEDIVYWLNAFPTKGNASRTVSPATIVEGSPKPDLSYDRPIFGSYCIAYTSTTNDMKPRAVPSIALKSADGYMRHYFMSLHSGKQIHSKKWTELPIDQEVIDRVEELGADEGQPEMQLGQPIFEWIPGTNIDDVEQEDYDNDVQDEVYEYEVEEVYDDTFEDPDGEQGANEENNDDMMDVMNNDEDQRNVNANNDENNDDENDNDDTDNDDENTNDEDNDNMMTSDEEYIDESDDDDISDYEMPPPSEDDEIAETEEQRRPARSTAGKAPIRYEPTIDSKKRYDDSNLDEKERRQFLQTKLHHQLYMKKCERLPKKKVQEQHPCTMFHTAVDVMFTQMSAKQGIKLFGERAIAAMYKELKQLVDEGAMPGKPVVQPIDVKQETKTRGMRYTQ